MSNNSLTDNVLAVGIDDGHDGIKVAYFEPEKKEIVCFRMPSVAQEGIGDMASAPEHELIICSLLFIKETMPFITL